VTNYQKRYLLFSYLLVGLFLFFGSYKDRVARAQFLGNTIFFPFTYSVREFKSIRDLREENRAQKEIIGGLMLQNIDLETRFNKVENSRIHFAVADTNYVLADVIGFSGNFFGRTIVVNRGMRHGVRIDNPVFSTRGIVGRVVVAYNNFSIVLPLNHYNFKLAVLNRNSGIQGILVSDIYSNTSMSFLRFGANIAVGDTIVTSNLSHIFPPNFPVGRVIRLEESTDALYLRGVIEPFNDVRNLQNVFVLLREKLDVSEVDIETDY